MTFANRTSETETWQPVCVLDGDAIGPVPVTFDGERFAVLRPGESVLSDPIADFAAYNAWLRDGAPVSPITGRPVTTGTIDAVRTGRELL